MANNIHCPFCNGTDITVDSTWLAKRIDDEANPKLTTKYQCERREVCGKEFWISAPDHIFKNRVRELPTFRGHLAPAGGWKSGGVYLVRVCFDAHNPVFRAILHMSQVPAGEKFALRGEIWSRSMDCEDMHRAYYIEVEQELCVIE